MDNTSFSAVITKEDTKGGWTYVVWPGSAGFLGTRRAKKVSVKVGNHEFNLTCLPVGDGTHMVPLNRSVMSSIGKQIGERIVLEVRKPQ